MGSEDESGYYCDVWRSLYGGNGKGALSGQESAGARHGGRLFVGGQLSGGSVCAVCQRASGIHRYFLRQYDGCGKSGNGCGGDFHQCEADRGKFPKR